MLYIQVSASVSHTALLRSDGNAVTCGCNDDGQSSIPPLEEGMSYIQVSAGTVHTVLLRSDGNAVTCGCNVDGQCNIPPLEEGMLYIQVSAGVSHTALLRSDGNAVTCGCNDDGQCNIPSLEEGMSYTRVLAGGYHTVLPRSDGSVVVCGRNSSGQCNIPPLQPGQFYTASSGREHIFQLDFVREDDAIMLTCSDLAGHEALRLKALGGDLAWETHRRIAQELSISLPSLQLVLPDGDLLGSVCRANPLATIADVSENKQVGEHASSVR